MTSLLATKVAHLPELLVPIGFHLDPPDLLKCVQVSRLWNHHLIPILWRTIDDSHYSWPILTNTNFHRVSSKETTRQVQSIFETYGLHIRHLRLHIDRIILTASIARTCTRLRSLSVSRDPIYVCVGLNSDDLPKSFDRNNGDPYSQCLVSPILQDLPRPDSPPTEKNLLNWIAIQRSWLLILENPSLESLELEGEWAVGPSGSTQFFIETLSTLSKLTRLKNKAVRLTLQTLLELCSVLQDYESDIHIDNHDEHLTTVFPHVRILTIRQSQLQISVLFNFLLHLPNLEQLTLNHVIPSDSLDWCSGTALGGTLSRLKELNFTHTELPLAGSLNLTLTYHILPWLPHLTALSMKVLESRTATVLASCCPLLESVKLSAVLTDLYDVDTVPTLLYNCPKLKVLDTIRYSVDANSLLERPVVCRRLETFRCGIVGLLRLTAAEENLLLYNPWLASQVEDMEGTMDISTLAAMLKEKKVALPEVFLKVVQIKKQHQRVYNELGELTSLKILDLGLRNYDQWHSFATVPIQRPNIYHTNGQAHYEGYGPTLNTLKLSLDSGLDRLSTLERLEVFGFNGVDHRIGIEELDWMLKSWPQLKEVRGLQHRQFSAIKFLHCPKTDALREHIQELLPSLIL